MVDALVRRTGRTVGGAEMLLRYEGDQYAGGGPSAVTTLWLARALLQLALTEPENETAREVCGTRAEASLRAVLAHGTPTGLLPEMIGPGPGEMWAVPHAWSTASFVDAARAVASVAGEASRPRFGGASHFGMNVNLRAKIGVIFGERRPTRGEKRL